MRKLVCVAWLLVLACGLVACAQKQTAEPPTELPRLRATETVRSEAAETPALHLRATPRLLPTETPRPAPTETQRPIPTETAKPPPTATPQQKEPVALAQEFVDLLTGEAFADAVDYFDNTLTAALPADKLKEVWESLIVQVGALQRQVAVRTEKQGQYDAVLVTLEFARATLDVRIVVDNGGQIAGLWFAPSEASSEPTAYVPPDYVTPDAFEEHSVVIGSADWALPGTVSLPVGKGPFPAVVLVHGSGPNDRDESIGPNKPFRDLAWGLASRGIAVLRYEKRTKEHADKLVAVQDSITVNEETIEDALAAISLLREEESIDPERVFVLGHSLGGALIPRIGALDSEIAGLIVMAGASRPLEDLMLEQLRYLANLDGNVSQQEQSQLDEVEQQVARIKDPELSPDSSELLLGAAPAYWLDLRDYNPPEMALTLDQPMLILQGERDYQVTLEDYESWTRYLSSRPNVAFKIYPDLNHLFMPGEGPSMPAEYETPGHVAEHVVDDIANWIKQH